MDTSAFTGNCKYTRMFHVIIYTWKISTYSMRACFHKNTHERNTHLRTHPHVSCVPRSAHDDMLAVVDSVIV